MYSNLYKGLGLKLEDLSKYNVPLVKFNGKTVILKGMIRLPIQTGSEVVEVDFIVVDAYSPYTAILARLWLYAMGAVFFTLHVKLKYLTKGQFLDAKLWQGIAWSLQINHLDLNTIS